MTPTLADIRAAAQRIAPYIHHTPVFTCATLDVETGVVRLQLSGACGSCAVSAATLNGGVNRILRDRLSWITDVIGDVQESDIDGYGGWTPKHS